MLARLARAPRRTLQAALVGVSHRDAQRAHHLARDLVLQREYMLDRGVDFRAPQRAAVRRAEQLGRHAQLRTAALQAAVDDRVDRQLAAGVDRIDRTAVI